MCEPSQAKRAGLLSHREESRVKEGYVCVYLPAYLPTYLPPRTRLSQGKEKSLNGIKTVSPPLSPPTQTYSRFLLLS